MARLEDVAGQELARYAAIDVSPSGILYDNWRAPDPMSWDQAYAVAFRESEEAAAAGDYSKPANRQNVLGIMRENKLAQWAELIQAEEQEQEALEDLYGDDWERFASWSSGLHELAPAWDYEPPPEAYENPPGGPCILPALFLALALHFLTDRLTR